MDTSLKIVQVLVSKGFNFFTGVPDSTLAGIIAELTQQNRYLSSVREDEAIGIAAGAFLAGKSPVVLMQNSGLGNSLNALTSLNLIYSIPCLLLISWRGYQGNDAPEHLIMGECCTEILSAVSIAHRVMQRNSIVEDITWAKTQIEANNVPVALMLTQATLK